MLDWISFIVLAIGGVGAAVYVTNKPVPRIAANAWGIFLVAAFAFGIFLQWDSRGERSAALAECHAEFDAGKRETDCEPFYR